METKKQLREGWENAELRAVTHFRKLNEIENILKRADRTHEKYFETVDKKKRVIFTNTTPQK